MAENDDVHRTFEENKADLEGLLDSLNRMMALSVSEDVQKNNQNIHTEYLLHLKSCYEQLCKYNDPNYLM